MKRMWLPLFTVLIISTIVLSFSPANAQSMMVCKPSANLPCGKANANQSLPATNAWCRQNPNIDYIPAYISGHDRLYNWCRIQGMPTTNGSVKRIDARGFFTDY